MFSIVGNYLRPSNNYRQLIFNINAVVLILDNLLRLTKLVKCIPEFKFFAAFLKNRNTISKIKSYRLCSFKVLLRLVLVIFTQIIGSSFRMEATRAQTSLYIIAVGSGLP